MTEHRHDGYILTINGDLLIDGILHGPLFFSDADAAVRHARQLITEEALMAGMSIAMSRLTEVTQVTYHTPKEAA